MYKRLPALVLAFLFVLLLGWDVAVAEDDGKTESDPTVAATSTCRGYQRLITDEMIDQWKKVIPYTAGRVSKVIEMRYKDVYGIDQKLVYANQASGSIMGNYLVTAAHVLDDIPEGLLRAWLHFNGVQSYSDLRISPSRLEIEFEKIKISGEDLLDTTQKPIISAEFDIALVKLQIVFPHSYATALLYGATQDILEIGKGIVVMGNPLGMGREFRSGEVSNMQPTYKEFEHTKKIFGALHDGSFFSVNIDVYPGDSGSIVFAFDACGEPVAVGIAFAYIGGAGNSWMVVIRSEAIHGFLRQNGIDVSNFYVSHMAPVTPEVAGK